MRTWLAGMLAGVLALPALAAPDMATINEVARTWDRYSELSSQDKPEAVDLFSASSLVHLDFLRDAALHASAEQVRRLPVIDRIAVYMLRATQSDAALRAMDARAVATLCMSRGWIGIRPNQPGMPLPGLTHVTLVDGRAIGELGPPTETQFQFGPAFVREDGQWRFVYASMVPDASASVEEVIRKSGMGETRVLEMSLARVLDGQAPSLAALDRAPVDDAAARARLNETWPDYAQWQRLRVEAIRDKAENGDAFAQYVTGSLLYTGAMPQAVAKDEAAGLAWLEKASDGGQGEAAWLAFLAIRALGPESDALTARALPHLQRAAAHGREADALLALSGYYQEGLGGLPRDCRQAADWAARAEEAGAKEARNNLVWIWATCPVPGQRDPDQALRLAQFMIERKDTLPWQELDTVAAALAASGDFDGAVRFQSMALEKLERDPELPATARTAARKDLKARLSRYRSGRDYVLDQRTPDPRKAARQ